MELEFRDDRRRGRIVVVLGVILAVVAGGAAYYFVSQAQQQAGRAEVTRIPAVVAVKTIPARQVIEAAAVTLREVPIDETNANGIATDPLAVIGRIPAVSILQGQLVTTNLLASSTEGSAFSILGPDETVAPDSEAWRAVSVTVPDDLAVGGLVKAGQTVDLVVTAIVNVPADLIQQGKYYSDRSTKIVWDVRCSPGAPSTSSGPAWPSPSWPISKPAARSPSAWPSARHRHPPDRCGPSTNDQPDRHQVRPAHPGDVPAGGGSPRRSRRSSPTALSPSPTLIVAVAITSPASSANPGRTPVPRPTNALGTFAADPARLHDRPVGAGPGGRHRGVAERSPPGRFNRQDRARLGPLGPRPTPHRRPPPPHSPTRRSR
jgi:hypothetical protein